MKDTEFLWIGVSYFIRIINKQGQNDSTKFQVAFTYQLLIVNKSRILPRQKSSALGCHHHCH